MRRTMLDIQHEINRKLGQYNQAYTITEYNRNAIRFNNGVIFTADILYRYRLLFVKGKTDNYFKYHDSILEAESPITFIEDIIKTEVTNAQRQGGKNCQHIHGDKIKENLNTGTPWNIGLTLPPSWNKGLTKDMNESVMKISQAKMGNANPCYGKVYTQEEKDHRSSIMKQKILNGEFTPAVRNSLTHWTAELNGKKYRSTWERNFHKKYPHLLYEYTRIPYRFDNEDHIYITDFIDINEKIVYEIKPSTLVDDAKVQAKSKAAMEWCASNDYTFIVVTELTESCLQDENKKYKRD